MKKKEKTADAANENDQHRFAYMIAWRDKYIEALQEQLAGWEEKDALLCSLLYCALARIASGDDEQDEREVLIDKREIANLLGAFECQASDTGDAYAVRFTKKQANVQENAQESIPESAQKNGQESIAGEHADGGKAKES